MTTTKFCKTCGKIMRDVAPNKRFCAKCSHAKKLAYERSRSPENKKPAVKCSKPTFSAWKGKYKPLAQCVHEAILLGISYGQYVQHGLDREGLK